MKKRYLHLLFCTVVIISILFMQGCNVDQNLKGEKIVAPENNITPLKGVWSINQCVEAENIADTSCNRQMLDKKVIFDKHIVMLANEKCNNPKYKIKRVDTKEYFLYHYRLKAEQLGVDAEYIDVISVSSDDKPFYDFIRIDQNKTIVYINGIFYYMDKVSDDTEEFMRTFENNKEKEYIDNDALEKEPDLLRSGVLLGLYDEAKEQYHTIWISSLNRILKPVLEVSNLFVPRKTGFWRIGVETKKNDESFQDELFAYPVDGGSKQISNLIIESQINMPEQDSQTGNIKQHIRFVGNDYMAIEYIEEFKDEKDHSAMQLKVIPIDNIRTNKGIRISDIAGEPGKKALMNSAESLRLSQSKEIISRLEPMADERNFTVVRRNGHWILRGRLNYKVPKDLNDYLEFNINTIPPDKLINYDELHVGWNYIKSVLPEAVDAYTSPNKELLIAIGQNNIYVYTIKDNIIDNKPLKKIPIGDGESVVMAQWATGQYINKWEQSLSYLSPRVIKN